jgi:hypothetical protein
MKTKSVTFTLFVRRIPFSRSEEYPAGILDTVNQAPDGVKVTNCEGALAVIYELRVPDVRVWDHTDPAEKAWAAVPSWPRVNPESVLLPVVLVVK